MEVGPTEFVLDLFVALLDPVPQPLDPHDLGEGWELFVFRCAGVCVSVRLFVVLPRAHVAWRVLFSAGRYCSSRC